MLLITIRNMAFRSRTSACRKRRRPRRCDDPAHRGTTEDKDRRRSDGVPQAVTAVGIYQPTVTEKTSPTIYKTRFGVLMPRCLHCPRPHKAAAAIGAVDFAGGGHCQKHAGVTQGACRGVRAAVAVRTVCFDSYSFGRLAHGELLRRRKSFRDLSIDNKRRF